jgi:hypothetical protein
MLDDGTHLDRYFHGEPRVSAPVDLRPLRGFKRANPSVTIGDRLDDFGL